MTRFTRLFRFPLLVLLALSTGLGAASAAEYPLRPVKWVVPYPPGGTTDVLARIMAQWLTEKMGQPFLVENRPGAGPTATPCCW
jgi:tripartite-type tricarboxylate transporter receptor subunit TctC